MSSTVRLRLVLVALLGAVASLLATASPSYATTIAITNPPYNDPLGEPASWVSGTQVPISAEVTGDVPAEIVGVGFYWVKHDIARTHIPLGTDTEPPYEMVWDSTTLPDQKGWINAALEDSAGNNYGDDYRITTIDNTAPTVTIRDIDGADGEYDVISYVEDAYILRGGYIGKAKLDDGPWVQGTWHDDLQNGNLAVTLTGVTVGQHRVYVRVTDIAGNRTTVSKAFTAYEDFLWGFDADYKGHAYATVYKENGAGLLYSEAEAAAQNEGGLYGLGAHLVTINNQAEEDWIKQTFDVEGERWIGLAKGDTGSWGWISGETSAYRNWADGEPTDGDTFTSQKAGGAWYGRGAAETDSTLRLPALIELYIAPEVEAAGPFGRRVRLSARPWARWSEPIPTDRTATLERRTLSGAWRNVGITATYDPDTYTQKLKPNFRLRPKTTYRVRVAGTDVDGVGGLESWTFRTRSAS